MIAGALCGRSGVTVFLAGGWCGPEADRAECIVAGANGVFVGLGAFALRRALVAAAG